MPPADLRLRLICRRTRPAKVVNWEKQEMGTESYGQTSFLLSRYRLHCKITISVWMISYHVHSNGRSGISIHRIQHCSRKSHICWFPQLWCEEQFWGRLVGWCKLVGHEHDQEPLWPSVNCLCRKWYNYWCIKSRLADPDLIILGHLEIYSPEPQSSVVATLARCSLCTQPRLAQESLLHTLSWFLFIQFCLLQATQLDQIQSKSLLSPQAKTFQISRLRQVAPLWLLLAKSEKP